jgi:predicted DNA-binding transcriptional regulator YafY
MAKLQQLQRLLVIIRKLDSHKQYVPTEELQEYVRRDMATRGVASGYSLRTIQRDIAMIEELFGIIISHEQGLGYHIDSREMASPDRYEELLMNLDVLSALDADSGLQDYVITEHHRASGSELMPYLLNAIRNSHTVEFDYTLVRHGNTVSRKSVEPYFLKESKHRWYLIGKDDGQIKVFGLDRITNLSIGEGVEFLKDGGISPHEMFRDSFGIWNDPNMPIEDIILSYSPLDGRFLKTLPLHHSQEILTDNEKEFRIKVRLRITNDFVMELLSRSGSLTVIEPVALRERVSTIYKEAGKRNSNE